MRKLSDRQKDCLRLAAEGLTSKDIALKLGIGYATVANHIGSAIVRLGATNRSHAVAIAKEKGLLEASE